MKLQTKISWLLFIAHGVLIQSLRRMAAETQTYGYLPGQRALPLSIRRYVVRVPMRVGG